MYMIGHLVCIKPLFPTRRHAVKVFLEKHYASCHQIHAEQQLFELFTCYTPQTYLLMNA